MSWIVTTSAVLAAESDHSRRLQDLAYRHVMFEQVQDNHRAAYIAADYYERRGVVSETLKLARAAASLELGYLDHGRALIADLEQASLLPPNQSRLRLYLARDAHLRRDWAFLETQLEALADLAVETRLERDYQAYLHVELARHQQNFQQATRFLTEMDKDFSLRPYALFNVAVALAGEDQDKPTAIVLLTELVEAAPKNYAGLMLSDRARVALAEIHIAQRDWLLARQSLSQVSATHRHGPHALAQLARLDMQDERYENAAAIWQHLLNQHPWHHASTHATSGLGYALQVARGDESAFQVYTSGLANMNQQRHRLELAREQIKQVLQAPEAFSATDESLIIWLSDALGHEDWLDWLASTEIRTIANRWQALDQAYKKLLDDRDQLDSMLGVDAEQQVRVSRVNQIVVEGQLSQQLMALTAQIKRKKQGLLTRRFTFDENLAPFASSEQQQAMAEISALRQRFTQLAPLDSRLLSHSTARLARLEGMVRFQVFDQLPREKQKRISLYDRQLAIATQAEQRLNRIVTAARRQPGSISDRIRNLATRGQALERETELALARSRLKLLASLDQLILADQDRLQVQMAGLQYDITRLADRRVAAEVTP